MPNSIHATLGLTALALALAPQQPSEATEPTADERAVRAAIEDYVQGFYAADPSRLERALSKDLTKVGYYRGDDQDQFAGPLGMTYEQALELAASWNAGGAQGELPEPRIQVFDVADKTAAGMLVAAWGQDYLQLVEEEQGWRIRQVLWQSPPRD